MSEEYCYVLVVASLNYHVIISIIECEIFNPIRFAGRLESDLRGA
jgi:hypothetical protein